MMCPPELFWFATGLAVIAVGTGLGVYLVGKGVEV